MAVPPGARCTLFLSIFVAWTHLSNAQLESIKANFREFVFDQHNSFRKMFNVDGLQMNENLNNDAQAWAEKVAKDCKVSYSEPSQRDKSMGGYTDEYVDLSKPEKQKRVGVSWDNSFPASLPQVIGTRLYESRDTYQFLVYNGPNKGPLFEAFRPFTQMVWKNTKYVGYGYAVNPSCKPGSIEYFVIRYFPGGNLEGQFKDNVFPIPSERDSSGGAKQVTSGADAQYSKGDKTDESNKKPKSESEQKELADYAKLGVTMFNSTMTTICWYLELKIFPNGKANRKRRVDYVHEYAVSPYTTSRQSLDYFINRWGQSVIPEYHSQCAHLLGDPRAAPPANESLALNDGGRDYPFRGYWYCLINYLRRTEGDEAIAAIMSERTHGRKDFVQTFLERQNQFRKHHGVKPFQLNQTLTDLAQAWSERMAKDCHLFYKPMYETIYIGHGVSVDKYAEVLKYTGETIRAGHVENDLSMMALDAANFWYKQMEYYPFPEGLDDAGISKDDQNIDGFTQTLWRGTEHVGYGVAINKACKAKNLPTYYVTARYYQRGNVPGWYSGNVLPPKGSAMEKEYLKYREVNEALVVAGMDMYDETFYKMCWYVKMRVEKTGREWFVKCHGSTQMFMFENDHKDRLPTYTKLGHHIDTYGERKLTEYHLKCKSFLKTPKAVPVHDESEALHDRGREYAFKAYFHCLIHALREKHGDKAIEEVKGEKAKFLLVSEINEDFRPLKYKH